MTTDDNRPPTSSVRFDRAASYYAETRGFPPGEEGAVAACFCAAGDLTPASQMLEIGVGAGRIALPLAARVGAVYGVDLSRPMIDRLRAKRSGETVYLTQADATRLPFPSAVFDAAVAVHVFHLSPTGRGRCANWRACCVPARGCCKALTGMTIHWGWTLSTKTGLAHSPSASRSNGTRPS